MAGEILAENFEFSHPTPQKGFPLELNNALWLKNRMIELPGREKSLTSESGSYV